MQITDTKYGRFTIIHALQLAAPHTWAAAIFPVLYALSFAIASNYIISVSLALTLLVISILLQSAVNVFNDYKDFKSGADSNLDNVDITDAVLVYNNINPNSALRLSIGCVVAAFILGFYCIYTSGYIPFFIALIGVLFVFLYSGGKTPISYLPLGELVSGIVMGGLITFASWFVLTKSLNLIVLIWSIPLIISISLIMMTNNCCDIEKDIKAGRKTLPCIFGRMHSVAIYRAFIAIMFCTYIAITFLWYQNGLFVIPFVILFTLPLLKAIINNPLLPDMRIQAMSQIISLNIAFNAGVCITILAACSGITL